jgi:beta-fructofuranosidase
LSFTREGQMRQIPAPQLEKLRGKGTSWPAVRLEGRAQTFKLPESNTLEIATELDLQTAASVKMDIKDGTGPSVAVTVTGLELRVPDAKAPLSLAKGERTLNLRIFVDRSVLEVFANERACITKVIPPLATNATLEIRADGGVARVKRLGAWPMKRIW